MDTLSRPSPRLMVLTASIGAAAAIYFETAPDTTSQGAQLIMLILGALLCYNLLVVKNFFTLGDRLRQYIFLFYWIVLIALFCFPIDEIYGRKLLKPQSAFVWLQICLGGIVCLTSLINYLLLRAEIRSNNLLGRLYFSKSLSTPVFLLVSCGWVFLCTNLISLRVFENIPHVQDAISQFFQAKIFAGGTLTATPPPIPEFFQYPLDNIISADRWYSQYPPGHPFLLMLGLLINVPWMVNPVLASLSAILLYKAGKLYYGEREARGAVVLYCLSPFVLFMSASYMNHVSSLFFELLFFYCILKSAKTNSLGYGILTGLALGAMLNIRTGDAVATGTVLGLFFLGYSLKKGYFKTVLAAGAVFSVMAAVLLWFNYTTNGDPFLFGYQVRWGGEHTIGFTQSKVMGAPPHTFLLGIGRTMSNFIAMNQNLFEWPVPGLLPLAILFAPFGCCKGRREFLLLLAALGAPVFYFFYFFQDLCLGPRFYYTSLPFILLLTARAVFLIAGSLSPSLRLSPKQVSNAILIIFGSLFLYTAGFRAPMLWNYYADRFWDVDDQLMKEVRKKNLYNSLIFQKGYGARDNGLGSGFLHNSPQLNTPVVFARDLGKQNKELAAFYPYRCYYLTWRDTNNKVHIEPLHFSEKIKK